MLEKVRRNLQKNLLGIASFSAMLLINSSAAFAVSSPNITQGLQNVSSATLATKILTIGVGIGALSGAVAAIMLIILGFKLKVSNEQERARVKEQIKWVFIGLGLVALSVSIVGFVAFLVKGNGA